MNRFTQRPVSHPRRGVIAVLSAVLLIGLISMFAFAIDLGYLATRGLRPSVLQMPLRWLHVIN